VKDPMALAVAGLLAVFVLVGGCEREKPPPPETPDLPPLATQKPSQTSNPMSGRFDPHTSGKNELPPGHPVVAKQAADAKSDLLEPVEAPTKFEGIAFDPQDGWQAVSPPATSGSGFTVAGPVAMFKLTRAEGDEADAIARLTYFPGMKDVPVQSQLNRWCGQVTQPDGGSTKDVAKMESWEENGVKVSLADMTGTMSSEKGTVRMIAVVIEHPKGPHFLKVVGPVDTMEKWRDSVIAYLRSGRIVE